MAKLSETQFVCLDCETTGLDPESDRLIEIAICTFTLEGIQDSFETLVDPGLSIAPESIKIHNITDKMVEGKPNSKEVLPTVLSLAADHVLMGHGIDFDLSVLKAEAKRAGLPTPFSKNKVIDTLRLARLYGGSAVNSLEYLRKHFNIEQESAHRAMGDVIVNIQVFKHLIKPYKTLNQVFDALSKPILLPFMPLGKHKGRKFKEIPEQYLTWALRKDFDQDLIYSIKTELKKRKTKHSFFSASNPFMGLDDQSSN